MNNLHYQSGQRVIVGPYECEIEERFGETRAYRAHTEIYPHPVILKQLRAPEKDFTNIASTATEVPQNVLLAQRAQRLFEKSRVPLTSAGMPNMLICDDNHSLTQHLPGISLSMIRDLTLQDIRNIIADVSCAIDALMEQGLVHGDLKLDNTIIDIDARTLAPSNARIIDLGIMGEAGEHSAIGKNLVIGTANWMAPEQARGMYAGTTDIFLLGMKILSLLEHTLLGVDLNQVIRPRKENAEKLQDRAIGTWLLPGARNHLEAALLSRGDIDTGLARKLLNVAIKSIRQDPNARYQSGAEVRDVLIR